ncbi:hypothetical protein AVEN_17932-1 [Araneus ventricosus]|uniref:Uncharacterized protein n=1 Tax=Araneus ventricosus TaxID=182803 RepID=A0A4Y2G1P6_ARAVE|nr:hypothetical protein AVEN_17932-1 [Araneus ventricosus]
MCVVWRGNQQGMPIQVADDSSTNHTLNASDEMLFWCGVERKSVEECQFKCDYSHQLTTHAKCVGLNALLNVWCGEEIRRGNASSSADDSHPTNSHTLNVG